jgi:hypothetical protein
MPNKNMTHVTLNKKYILKIKNIKIKKKKNIYIYIYIYIYIPQGVFCKLGQPLGQILHFSLIFKAYKLSLKLIA